ncbi:MAG: hypothetical protein Q9196_005831, partial [Gyalolechia fulgens]
MTDLDGQVSVRKSARQRRPNKKYSADEITNIDILSSASEEEVQAWQQLAGSDNDDEFDVTQVVEQTNDPEEDVISSASAASDGSGIATPHEDFDDAASYASADATRAREDGHVTSPDRQAKENPNLYRKRKNPQAGPHTRGLGESVTSFGKGSKADYVYSLVGNAPQDLLHMVRCRDQWLEDVAAPRRPHPSGTKGMRHFFSHPEEIRHFEATEGWDWYYGHGGCQRFAEVQQSHHLSADEGINYIPQPSHPQQTVFIGPYGRQSRFDLPLFQSMGLDQAWKHAPLTNGPEGPEGVEPTPSESRKRRDGWMINVGTGVRSVEWAPNHSGDTQYLAIATLQPKNHGQIGRLKFSPAFTAQSFPSSIQIWSFSASEAADRQSLLDPDHPPRLRMVICFGWGDAKHLRWCPMPRNFRSPDQEETKTPIGLLAAVFSDGNVRVLNIHLPESSTQETIYLNSTNAAFTAKPPSTLCTSVTWLSPTHLAVGCANGHLAIWSIYPHPSSLPPSLSPPPPILYTPLHTTYILTLTTAYPILPHLLATSSASGHLRLTSLLNPTFDSVLSPRMRHAPSAIAFSEPCAAFLTADDNDSMRAWPVRRFFAPINIARIPAPGMCIATGVCHSGVLAGCADGTVCAVNPLRKLWFPKALGKLLPVFRSE